MTDCEKGDGAVIDTHHHLTSADLPGYVLGNSALPSVFLFEELEFSPMQD